MPPSDSRSALRSQFWNALVLVVCTAITVAAFLAPISPIARAASADNFFATADEAIKKSVTKAGAPSVDSSEGWNNTGVYVPVDNIWTRMAASPEGAVYTVDAGANAWQSRRTTVTTSCVPIPTSLNANTKTTCIYVESGAAVIISSSSSCTSTSGETFQIGDGDCFMTSGQLYGITASGTAGVSSREYMVQ